MLNVTLIIKAMKNKRVQKLSDEKVELIQQLAAKIEQALAEMKIKPEDELEVFAETVALLIIHWGRVSNWSVLETTSYAGYVMSNFMEKGIGAEIKDMNSFMQFKSNKNVN